MRSAIASGLRWTLPLVSVVKCFSSVDANAAGDEKSRFFRRPLTNLVPVAPVFCAGLFAALAIGVEILCIARSSAVNGTESACKIALGVERLAVLVDQIGLQPPDHDLRELLVVRQDVA